MGKQGQIRINNFNNICSILSQLVPFQWSTPLAMVTPRATTHFPRSVVGIGVLRTDTHEYMYVSIYIFNRKLIVPGENVKGTYKGFATESGRYMPNLFLQATLCLLNLSSGENLAG